MTREHQQTYLPRHMESTLREALADTPAVALLGPRQSGKSTLALHHDPDRHYISLDDQNILTLAKNDPQGFIAELPERVTIDEIQRAPELRNSIALGSVAQQ